MTQFKLKWIDKDLRLCFQEKINVIIKCNHNIILFILQIKQIQLTSGLHIQMSKANRKKSARNVQHLYDSFMEDETQKWY